MTVVLLNVFACSIIPSIGFGHKVSQVLIKNDLFFVVVVVYIFGYKHSCSSLSFIMPELCRCQEQRVPLRSESTQSIRSCRRTIQNLRFLWSVSTERIVSVKHKALVQRRYSTPRHRVTVWVWNKNIIVPVKPHYLDGIQNCSISESIGVITSEPK